MTKRQRAIVGITGYILIFLLICATTSAAVKGWGQWWELPLLLLVCSLGVVLYVGFMAALIISAQALVEWIKEGK